MEKRGHAGAPSLRWQLARSCLTPVATARRWTCVKPTEFLRTTQAIVCSLSFGCRRCHMDPRRGQGSGGVAPGGTGRSRGSAALQAESLTTTGAVPARTGLEALALEPYRPDRRRPPVRVHS